MLGGNRVFLANSLSYMRPFAVGYVRRQGPIAAAASSAWTELRNLIGPAVGEAWVGYGLLHGSSGLPDSIYFDACIELPNAADWHYNGLLATQTIPGGAHLSSAPVAAHWALTPAFGSLHDHPLIEHGLAIADDRPAVITYSRAVKGRAKRGWSLTLNMPLCWNDHSRGRAA